MKDIAYYRTGSESPHTYSGLCYELATPVNMYSIGLTRFSKTDIPAGRPPFPLAIRTGLRKRCESDVVPFGFANTVLTRRACAPHPLRHHHAFDLDLFVFYNHADMLEESSLAARVRARPSLGIGNCHLCLAGKLQNLRHIPLESKRRLHLDLT